jgi:hypothetical protein
VRADAAALFRLTLAVDDRALDGTATGDCTDSGHDGFELVKGSEVKVGERTKQGEIWNIAALGGFSLKRTEKVFFEKGLRLHENAMQGPVVRSDISRNSGGITRWEKSH